MKSEVNVHLYHSHDTIPYRILCSIVHIQLNACWEFREQNKVFFASSSSTFSFSFLLPSLIRMRLEVHLNAGTKYITLRITFFTFHCIIIIISIVMYLKIFTTDISLSYTWHFYISIHISHIIMSYRYSWSRKILREK